ncbi:MAG TPA: alpha/beta hydrolase [Candidatus Dormibacteraeota bacterium]
MTIDAPAARQDFARVNGARLWYEVAGSGPALVMLHGHLLDSAQWDDQFAEFAREHRVVRFDARGFGRSDKPEAPFSYSDDLRAMLELLGIERAVLMGCSGGGATVIDFALAHPEMTAALVLVGSAVSGFQRQGERPAKFVAIQEALERYDVDSAVELALQLWTDGERRRPEQVDARARERTRLMTTALFARLDVDAEVRWLDPPAAGRLAELRMPVLAIVGGEDSEAVQSVARQVEAEAPGARRVVIPDAGHHPNMEHPQLFNETVLSFVRGIPAA